MGNIITIYSLITIRTGRVVKSYSILVLLTCLLFVSREGFAADLRGSLSPNPLQRLMKSSDQTQSNYNSYNDSGNSQGSGSAIKNDSPLYNAYAAAAASSNYSSNYAAPTAYVSTSVSQVPVSKSNSAYNNQFRTVARTNPANNVIANAARSAETTNTVSTNTSSVASSNTNTTTTTSHSSVSVVADSSAKTFTGINTGGVLSNTAARGEAITVSAPPSPSPVPATHVTISAPPPITNHTILNVD